MRCLVCGGRDFARIPKNQDSILFEIKKQEYLFVFRELNSILYPTLVDDDMYTWLPPKDLVIVSGGATGVDSVAIDWAVVNWCKFEEYKADWEKYGKRAGYIRNKQMLDSGIDLVVAFPGGKGTTNMVKIAKEAGVKVIEVKYGS